MKRRLLHILFFLVFMLIPLTAYSDKGKMLHAIVQVLEPEYASRWEIWRVSRKYIRAEEKASSGKQGEWLMVSNAPQSWVINTFTRVGRYYLDPGPSIDVHVPVFNGNFLPKNPTGELYQPPTKAIEELEFGEEISFLKRHNIKKAGEEKIDGIDTAFYLYNVDNTVFKINIKKDGTPLRLNIKNNYISYTIQYELYELDLKTDYSLFQPPTGINYQE